MAGPAAAPAVAEDDENFELVDYTAASAWEKFVASIESRLSKWRVVDGSLGEFNLAELQSQCKDLVVRRKQDRQEVRAQISRLCTRVSHLSYKGTTYALTLSVHPLLHAGTLGAGSGLSAFDGQFPPDHVPELEVDHSQTEPEPAWHPLHRWSGSVAMLYLQYVGDSSHWYDTTPDSTDGVAGLGDNYSVSVETAKLLMSSMNIALHNARCRLPAFVPVGDAWRCLFTGRAIGSVRRQHQHQHQPVHEAGTSTKFDSVCLTPVPSAYLQLGGLLELFVDAFRMSAYAPPAATATPDSPAAILASEGTTHHAAHTWSFVADTVHLAALHTYRIRNTYSRDWNAASPDFYYRVGDLNVGPANDPLRLITLSALFQRAPCRAYIDPQSPGRDRLYLKTSSAWLLSARMLPAERERTMLTEVIEDAFVSWAQSASDTNRHRHLNLAEQMEAHAEITSDMLVDLFGAPAGSQISLPGLDSAARDKKALEAIEAELERSFAEVYTGDEATESRPLSAAQLAARMPHGTAVPHGSLLWRLSEIILVATAKRSADFWGAPSILTFLRLLWAMALKEIRWRWENSQLLPRIPTAAEHVAEAEGARSGSQTPALAASSATDSQTQTHFSVHLRYALAHQKLEMINCCTERKLRMRTHIKSQLRRQGGAGGGRRLLGTMRSGKASPGNAEASAADIGEFEDIGTYASDSEGFVSAEDDYISDGAGCGDKLVDDSSDASLLLDEASLCEGSSTAERPAPVRLPPNATALAAADRRVDVQTEESELGRSGHDANYIDVAIASSLDSNSGFHHVSDVYERDPPPDTASSAEDSSAPPAKQAEGVRPSTDRSETPGGIPETPDVEELGADERAGGLHQSSSLRLLETGQPMWIPRVQMQPVLTEDMLREHETILMSFGTSAEGAQQRAQLQCAELISDMESFKAANPRCSLADFVRWHSPRDWVVPEGADEMEGSLSVRMVAASGDGNLWQRLWSEARRVPADRQRLLFDDEVEAEKALHYLEGTPVHALFASLLPTMLLIAYERLYKQPVVHRIGLLRSRLAALGTRIAQRVDWAAVDPDSAVFGSLMDDLEDLEVQTSRCVSLLCKFPGQYTLVEAVVQRGRASVATRDAQKVVLRALSKFNILSAAPARREYVFTADLKSADAACPGVPQRMHVAIEDDKSIRVVYARGQAPLGPSP
ncbi:hypothetical protein LPJ61_002620 [Coemansia biformis]|uniref:Rab3 GTPase-activating protein catalytic subunit n=1 Tax=Coemansia biformis TaxID=1286918 RepID=A0A9W7YCY7_9FUNG|nr:hypothetical protein LPJ61_002620 [Coemansia biformis]